MNADYRLLASSAAPAEVELCSQCKIETNGRTFIEYGRFFRIISLLVTSVRVIWIFASYESSFA